MRLPFIGGTAAARLTAVAVILGVALRTFHFLRIPSVWHDEAALIVNVLQKNFTELLGPLYWAEAGPPLFLWVERAMSLLLGDGVQVLRLLPYLASCASLFLVVSAARTLLSPPGALLSVLLFATSDRLLWHACEAKPHSFDVLLAAGLLVLHLQGRHWPIGRLLVIQCLLAPAAILLSYPGVFLSGTALLATLPRVWRERSAGVLVGYLLFMCLVFTTFIWLVLGPARAQRCPAMENCWTGHFPDWSQPWNLPGWSVVATLEVGRYCLQPVGQLACFLGLHGALTWWRTGRRTALAIVVTPLVLSWIAACMHQYPYGGSRLEVFTAPGLALLTGAGVQSLLDWPSARRLWLVLPLAGVLAAPPVLGLYRVVHPWQRPDCASAAAHVFAELRPGDAVLANCWEHVYYFRNLKDPLKLLGKPDLSPPRSCRVVDFDAIPSSPRCWLVVSDHAGNSATLFAMTPWFLRHRVLQQVEFEKTTVFLLTARQKSAPEE